MPKARSRSSSRRGRSRSRGMASKRSLSRRSGRIRNFSYVVDFDDIAPFCQFPGDFLLNMVNGMVSADAWKYIVNVPAPMNPPLDWLLKLPKEQELIEMEWIGNTFYYPVTRVELILDGKHKASFRTKPNNEVQLFAIERKHADCWRNSPKVYPRLG
jgi:hypothetical protein